eukprot:PITA_32383
MFNANQNKNAQNNEENKRHPYDFDVAGPLYLSKPCWREILKSSWMQDGYKWRAMACMVQAAYLLEVDRQENREGDKALAPKWWKFFKYRLVEVLVDDRDGSIFGAVFEWDICAALRDLLIVKPYKAPMSIIALRGTLLRGPTVRIDLMDDLTLFTTESLGCSYRFHKTIEAVRRSVEKFGSSEVSMAGHSLGAGVALSVGRALAVEGIFVETHLFNPPSVSLPLALRCVGDKLGSFLKDIFLPHKRKRNNDKRPDDDDKTEDRSVKKSKQNQKCGPRHDVRRWPGPQHEIQKWVPHLYLNCNDPISCHYSDYDYCERRQNFQLFEIDEKLLSGMLEESGMDRVAIKVYVVPKGSMNPLQAHGLRQWWSLESEPRMAFDGNTLIHHQLGSLLHMKNNS